MSRVLDYADISDEQAINELTELVQQKGTLQIISDVRLPNNLSVKDPRSFVCKDVSNIDGPDKDGFMVAYSAEGDWTVGKPAALLKRLVFRAQAEDKPEDHYGPKEDHRGRVG